MFACRRQIWYDCCIVKDSSLLNDNYSILTEDIYQCLTFVAVFKIFAPEVNSYDV